MRTRLTLLGVIGALPALGLACFPENDQTGDPIDTFVATLNVTVTGSGNGTVTVVDAGKPAYVPVFQAISCNNTGQNCIAHTDLDQFGVTTLTLEATPDSASVFDSWSGDCVPLPGTGNRSTVTMETETAFSCTAIFNANPISNCNNPFTISSTFDTDADWERNEYGAGVTGSNPSTGGNDGGYRLGGLDRPVNGLASFELHALHHTGYDPATQGAVTGIQYSEDRIVHAPVMAGEGIRGGLYLYDNFSGYIAYVGDPSVAFTGTSWTTVSVVADHFVLDHVRQPFRVGYVRHVDVVAGTGTLEHGIDNVVIKICR